MLFTQCLGLDVLYLVKLLNLVILPLYLTEEHLNKFFKDISATHHPPSEWNFFLEHQKRQKKLINPKLQYVIKQCNNNLLLLHNVFVNKLHALYRKMIR